MKTSIIAQAQVRARLIDQTLDQIGGVNMAAVTEIHRVENLGIQLASLINQGLVTRVTAEALEILSDTLDAVLLVREHGLPLWMAAKAHETILSTPVDGRDQLVLVLKVDGFNAVVTRPGTPLTADKKVGLLWAGKNTQIVREQERGTDGPAPEPKPVQPSVDLATGEVDLGQPAATVVAGLTTYVHQDKEYVLVKFQGNLAYPVVTGSRVYGRKQGVFIVRSVNGAPDLDGFPQLEVTRVLKDGRGAAGQFTAGPAHLEVAWVLNNHLIQWADAPRDAR